MVAVVAVMEFTALAGSYSQDRLVNRCPSDVGQMMTPDRCPVGKSCPARSLHNSGTNVQLELCTLRGIRAGLHGRKKLCRNT
jgi:hypothetical protein